MPEVPQNMQQNIAHMENQAGPQQPSSNYGYASPPPQQYQGDSQWQNQTSNQAAQQQSDRYEHYSAPQRAQQQATQPPSQYGQSPPRHQEPYDAPNFTPFPVLRHPPPNVPPTDEQKETTLESAREAVLASNDPEVQLTWAQDALAWAEIAHTSETRVALTERPRSQTPRIEHLLRTDAKKVVEFLAQQHHPKAEFLRGISLEFGKFGERMDKKEAFYAYKRAVDRGYARAQYRIGMLFESANEAQKAIKYYERGADAGDSASQYRLGMMMLLGQLGYRQDYEQGLRLVSISALTADENAPQGAYVFGMLQARELAQLTVPDQYLPRDINDARINIEKAAYLGFAKAQVRMGAAYELSDLSCDFNPALSLHYNNLAARQGDADAEMAISKWFLCGHEGIFEKNEEMACKYAKRAASSELPTAQFAMGYFNEVGIHVPTNLKEAREWYSKAAANGNKDAQARIEGISRSKTLSRKDHEQIALSKIRNQHQNAMDAPPMPKMPVLNMPEISRLNLNSNQQNPYMPQSMPYPSDGYNQGPPSGPPNLGVNQANPDFRPSSAFGVNPKLRQGGQRPDPYSQNGRPPPGQYDSYKSDPGRGRGSRPPAGQGPNPGYRPNGNSHPQSPISSPPGEVSSGPPPPAKIDIGYSAPLEQRARPRPGPSQPSQGTRPPPQSHTSASSVRPERGSSRPSGPGTPASQHRVDSRPGSTAPPNQNKPLPPASSQKPPPGKSSPAPPVAVNQPPGKGPKTFAQMGVPQSKDKGECVSRIIPSTHTTMY